MIQVTCPNANCGKLSAVKEEFAGRQAKCPACGTIMTIPGQVGIPSPAGSSLVTAPSIRKRSVLVKIRAWTTKVSRSPTIVLVNYVLGGLSILAGLLIALVLGKLGAARPVIATRNMSPERADEIAREFAKAQGALTSWMVTYFAVLGILMLIWGIAAVGDGIVLSKRVRWSRLVTLILAGFAGVLGLLSLVPVFRGYFFFVIAIAAYIGYAAWQFLALTRPRAVAQPS